MYHLNLKLLRSFAVVAAEGSVTKAAELLHLTQPTVSGHIKDLESELNSTLFYRTTRRLVLSEKGALLLPAVSRLLESAEDLKALGDSIQTESMRQFRLGAAMYTQELALRGELLDGFSLSMPEFTFQVDCRLQNNLVSDLLCGKLDAALLMGLSVPLEDIASSPSDDGDYYVITNESLIPDHLEKVILGYKKLGLWIPRNHPLAKKARIDTQDLNDINVVMLSEEHGHQIISPVQHHLKSNKANLVTINEGNAFAVRLYCTKHRVCGLGVDWFSTADDMVFRELAGLDLALEFSLVMGARANTAAYALYNYAREHFDQG
jgi:Transcriptional regulator